MNVKRQPTDDPHNLVILPGLLCDSRNFPRMREEFPLCHVVEDFYNGHITIKAMALHVLAQAPARFALIGHSMGARIALEVCRLAPDRVMRLALVNTGIHDVRPGEAEKRYALRDLGRAQGITALSEAWLHPMLAEATLSNHDLVAELRGMIHDAGLACFERQTEALLNRPSTSEVLSTIKIPTFAVASELDVWSPISQHQDIASRITGCQLRIIAGAGHMLPAEKPNEFHTCIREWLLWPE